MAAILYPTDGTPYLASSWTAPNGTQWLCDTLGRWTAYGAGGVSDVDDLTTDTLTAGNMLRAAAAGGLEERTPAEVRDDLEVPALEFAGTNPNIPENLTVEGELTGDTDPTIFSWQLPRDPNQNGYPAWSDSTNWSVALIGGAWQLSDSGGDSWTAESPASTALTPIGITDWTLIAGSWTGVTATVTGDNPTAAFIGQRLRAGATAPYTWWTWNGDEWVEDATAATTLLFAGENLNKARMVVTGTLTPSGVTGELIYYGIYSGFPAWSSDGEQPAGDNQTYLIGHNDDEWHLERKVDGVVVYHAETDQSPLSYPDGLTFYAPSTGTGVPTITAGTLTATFIGQRCRAGATAPYTWWTWNGMEWEQDGDVAIASPADNDMIQRVGGSWVTRTLAQIKTALGLGSAAYTESTDYATAAQGTDERTPTAHASSHATGGSDPLTPDDIGAASGFGAAETISGTKTISEADNGKILIPSAPCVVTLPSPVGLPSIRFIISASVTFAGESIIDMASSSAVSEIFESDGFGIVESWADGWFYHSFSNRNIIIGNGGLGALVLGEPGTATTLQPTASTDGTLYLPNPTGTAENGILMVGSNNLTDLDNASTARTNLELGSGNNVQFAAITGTTGSFSSTLSIQQDILCGSTIRLRNATNTGFAAIDAASISAQTSGAVTCYGFYIRAKADTCRVTFGTSDDVGLSRGGAANTLALGNGTAGSTTGTLLLTNLSSSGYIAGAEMTAPAAPAATGYRIFAEDNGAGKTRLMVVFATGAAQQIAIEP